MSESRQNNTERNPFTKPGFVISAALVIALIAAVIVIFLLPKGDGGAQQPAPSAVESNSAAASTPSNAASSSICGLPSTSETALGTAPGSNWELVGRMATPTDPDTFGPGVTDTDGFRSCFAHSPTGALYAAANVIALGSSTEQDELKLADKLLVPGPGRDAAIRDAENRSPSSATGTDSAQIRGFLIKSYSATEADVDLALELPNGALAHSVLSLRWVDGDWKVKAADDGQIFNGTSQLSSLSGFILWSGV